MKFREASRVFSVTRETLRDKLRFPEVSRSTGPDTDITKEKTAIKDWSIRAQFWYSSESFGFQNIATKITPDFRLKNSTLNNRLY